MPVILSDSNLSGVHVVTGGALKQVILRMLRFNVIGIHVRHFHFQRCIRICRVPAPPSLNAGRKPYTVMSEKIGRRVLFRATWDNRTPGNHRKYARCDRGARCIAVNIDKEPIAKPAHAHPPPSFVGRL